MQATQERYELVYKIMNKLSRTEIEAGCETFVKYGIEPYTNYKQCFMSAIVGFRYSCLSDFLTLKSNEEFCAISHTHYYLPEIVFLVACELLDGTNE